MAADSSVQHSTLEIASPAPSKCSPGLLSPSACTVHLQEAASKPGLHLLSGGNAILRLWGWPARGQQGRGTAREAASIQQVL